MYKQLKGEVLRNVLSSSNSTTNIDGIIQSKGFSNANDIKGSILD